jgi:hypothetical protein
MTYFVHQKYHKCNMNLDAFSGKTTVVQQICTSQNYIFMLASNGRSKSLFTNINGSICIKVSQHGKFTCLVIVDISTIERHIGVSLHN